MEALIWLIGLGMAGAMLFGLVGVALGEPELRPYQQETLKPFLTTDDSMYDVEVVGESNYQSALDEIAGGKKPESQKIVTIARLRPEPTNRHDPNAVKVLIDSHLVGYIPRGEAAKLKNIIESMEDAGYALTCPAKIVGGWKRGLFGMDQGDYGVRLDLPSKADVKRQFKDFLKEQKSAPTQEDQ